MAFRNILTATGSARVTQGHHLWVGLFFAESLPAGRSWLCSHIESPTATKRLFKSFPALTTLSYHRTTRIIVVTSESTSPFPNVWHCSVARHQSKFDLMSAKIDDRHERRMLPDSTL